MHERRRVLTVDIHAIRNRGYCSLTLNSRAPEYYAASRPISSSPTINLAFNALATFSKVLKE